MSKSKMSKTKGFGLLFDVQLSKKPLWREAHFQVKSVKNKGYGVFFDVQISKKYTLTNSTNLPYLTNLANTTNLTNVTNKLIN